MASTAGQPGQRKIGDALISDFDASPSDATEALRPLSEAGLDDNAMWAVVDAAPDGIVLVDEDGQILFVNRRTEELFHRDRAELLGRPVDELLPERFQQVHRAHRTRYRAGPKTRAMDTGFTLYGQRSDGTEFPVEISLSPLRTNAGLRVVAVVRDITERLETEAKQREVRETLDVVRDTVLILDADTLQFTHVNQGAVEQLGYSRDELLSMTMLHITPRFNEESVRDLLEPMHSGGQTSIVFATVYRRRDGSDFPVEILMQPIPGHDGTPPRYVKIVRDITERLATEDRLRRAEQHVRVVEDRERIARDLHDSVIQKLFAAGMTVQGVSARTSDPVHAARLSGVIDDLDDTIREIRTVIFSLQSDARESGGLRAAILRIVDEEVPALGFQPRVRFVGPVDATADTVTSDLLPALREALSNVARHAEASEVEIVVESADDVVLTVRDNGRGLSGAKAGGNGIANLSKRAAKLGGTSRVESALGGGTIVEWRVPNH